MPRWQVTMEVSDVIEADTAEQAIEKAGGMKGGWTWRAVDPERTEEQQFLVRAVLARVPDAVRVLAYVDEWDNGYFYDHYNVSAVRPDGSTVLCQWDVEHPLHSEMNDALTELSERDGPLGAGAMLQLDISDEQRALVLCQACAAVLDPDGWDEAGTPIWSERVSEFRSDALCPAGGIHVPVGDRLTQVMLHALAEAGITDRHSAEVLSIDERDQVLNVAAWSGVEDEAWARALVRLDREA